MTQNSPVVRTEGLGKRLRGPEGELVLLADINLSIDAAEAVAIVGASGSGKSTLLGLLAGLDLPSEGRVLLNGVDLTALDEDGRARLRRGSIGFIFQSFQLLSHLTAIENVMLPLELIGTPKAHLAAAEVLDRVGLGARERHYPRQLSGGEQQRVAIARAFVSQPSLLFADEPTGNLDRDTGRRVIELLLGLNQERRTTLILVTHDETLAGYCGRHLLLEGGRLKDFG